MKAERQRFGPPDPGCRGRVVRTLGEAKTNRRVKEGKVIPAEKGEEVNEKEGGCLASNAKEENMFNKRFEGRNSL
jgi:hypothetical protein